MARRQPADGTEAGDRLLAAVETIAAELRELRLVLEDLVDELRRDEGAPSLAEEIARGLASARPRR